MTILTPSELEFFAIWWKSAAASYFTSLYFWFTTLFIVIPLGFYTACMMDERRP